MSSRAMCPFARPLRDRRRRGHEASQRARDHGVIGILGSTYTGEYEPVKELNDAVLELNTRHGWDVGLHVDGASGAFAAPFTQPDLAFRDFRLPAVRSINASGHKYGLVYPGVGWVVWRSEQESPDDLIFHVNYLGGDQPTFSLNFSRERANPRAVLQLLAPRARGLHAR